MTIHDSNAWLQAGRVVTGNFVADFESCWELFVHGSTSGSSSLSDFVANDSDIQSPIQLIQEFAVERGAVACIDWTGEDDPDQLQAFVQRRLQDLGGPAIDWSFLEVFDEQDWSQWKRGDYVLKKLRAIDEALRKHQFVLGNLDGGGDEYFVFVARLDGFDVVERAAQGAIVSCRSLA